jgi:hypothetical protein
MKDTAKLSSIVLAILTILGGAGYQPALSQVEKIVTVEVNKRVDKLESEVKAQSTKLDTMLELLTSGVVKVDTAQEDDTTDDQADDRENFYAR